MVDHKKTFVPGTTIHVIDESEEEIQDINPRQYQKIAQSAYETHLRKIEVIIIELIWILIQVCYNIYDYLLYYFCSG